MSEPMTNFQTQMSSDSNRSDVFLIRSNSGAEDGDLNTKTKHRKRSMIVRSFIVVLFILIFIFVVVVVSFYWELKMDISQLKMKVHTLKQSQSPHTRRKGIQDNLSIQNHRQLATTEATSIKTSMKNLLLFQSGGGNNKRKTTTPLPALNLCGLNQHIVRSRRGLPYTDWKQTLISGDIHYDKVNGHVLIKKPGLYQIYAQMYPYKNENRFVKTLEFHVKRNHDIIALSSIPKTSCKTYCSQYLSRMVKLKKEDQIFLSSYTIGAQYLMSCDKALFGLYMLQGDEE